MYFPEGLENTPFNPGCKGERGFKDQLYIELA